jgi:hypothetical protein
VRSVFWIKDADKMSRMSPGEGSILQMETVTVATVDTIKFDENTALA